MKSPRRFRAGSRLSAAKRRFSSRAFKALFPPRPSGSTGDDLRELEAEARLQKRSLSHPRLWSPRRAHSDGAPPPRAARAGKPAGEATFKGKDRRLESGRRPRGLKNAPSDAARAPNIFLSPRRPRPRAGLAGLKGEVQRAPGRAGGAGLWGLGVPSINGYGYTKDVYHVKIG
jgi:hypothetical protein